MSLKKQVNKVKENWLILVLVVVLVMSLNFGGTFFNSFGGFGKNLAMTESMQDMRFFSDSGFAPDVEEREKTITSGLTTEVERGDFFEQETQLKNIISNYDSFLLNENVRKTETGFCETHYGSYTIKVNVLNYEDFVSELKELGEVESFNENTEDITGQYTDLKTELKLEKERLTRYQTMYDEAEEIADKIELNDRIFDQERTIKFLEDRIDNLDKKIDYATIYFNMNEKRSGYANIVFVGLGDLVKSFIDSINNLLKLIFVIIPWIVFVWIVFLIYKFVKKKNY